MSLFRKKESQTDEFLSVYGRLHQYASWARGRIPQAFRAGIKEDTMQRELLEWARRNVAALNDLSTIRTAIVSNRVTAGKVKAAVDQAKNLIKQIELRLKELGRQG